MMFRHVSENIKYIFWGTGKVGTDILAIWNDYGYEPDFFCCNDEKQWGQYKGGVKVISPEQVYEIEEYVIIVTCNAYSEVSQQLIERGVDPQIIIRANAMYDATWIAYMEKNLFATYNELNCNTEVLEGCLIDLSFGMILGGVERWNYSLANDFQKNAIPYKFIVPNSNDVMVENITNTINLNSEQQQASLLKETILTITNNMYKNVICNFPYAFFYAACFVKKYINKKLNIIVVFHNDEEALYNAYIKYADCIDHCLVISSVIKKKLIDGGFPHNKIVDLFWKISDVCQLGDRTYHNYSEPIHIGYAGRIQIFQKRMDILYNVLKKLYEEGIDFIANIAGTGDYLEIFDRQIHETEMADCVRFYGYIEHDKIFEFWKKNDICISCSDFEGHSISQSEAMAMGAVLVITNTSGAEDDVSDSDNGFIVPLADVDAIVARIKELYFNREKLAIMGEKSIKKIIERNKMMDTMLFWKNILV